MSEPLLALGISRRKVRSFTVISQKGSRDHAEMNKSNLLSGKNSCLAEHSSNYAHFLSSENLASRYPRLRVYRLPGDSKAAGAGRKQHGCHLSASGGPSGPVGEQQGPRVILNISR